MIAAIADDAGPEYSFAPFDASLISKRFADDVLAADEAAIVAQAKEAAAGVDRTQ